MTVISIEWGEDDHVRWADEADIHTARTLEALAERLPAASIVICEPSFYSCNNAERRLLASELAWHGHRLAPVPRAARELLEESAGPLDARSWVGWLRAICLAGAPRLGHTLLARHGHDAVRAALDVAHAIALGGVELPAVIAAREALGRYEDLDEPIRLALGDGVTYDPDLFAAVAVVAAAAPSRPDFERLMGMSEGPRWGSIQAAVRAWYRTRNGGDAFVRESTLTWSEYRRAARLAYGRIATARRHGQMRAA